MNLKDQRAETLAKARAVVTSAKATGRTSLTGDESAAVKGYLDAVEQIDTQITKATEHEAVLQQLAGLAPDDPTTDPDEPKGRGFTDRAKAGLIGALRSKSSFAADLSTSELRAGPFASKASPLSTDVLAAFGTVVSENPLGSGAVALAALFGAPVEAQGPTVRYYRMGQATAAVVAEGTLKPDAGVTAAPVDAALVKIASTFTISDELAEDAAFIVDSIRAEVIAGTLREENAMVVRSLTAASGALTASGAAANLVDIAASAIAMSESANGVTPSHLLVHPTTLGSLRQVKASGSGGYVVDPLTASPAGLHGATLVSTSAVAPGTAWLLSAGFGTFYRRGPLRVTMGYTGDNWQRNMATGRVETRSLAAIVRPQLVTKITLT